LDVVLLVGSLAIILVAAELFTNGIEWFGRRLNLAEGAVGSVLAAVATAMPETLIPVSAIVGPLVLGGPVEASRAVGVGAILGAPFMLSTLAMFVTGVAILVFTRQRRRSTGLQINVRILGRDVVFFLAAYATAIGTAFLPPALAWGKWVVAVVLLIVYGLYVRAHFTDEPGESGGEDLNRLHATRLPGLPDQPMELDALPGEHHFGVPDLRVIVLQLVVALGLIIVGAQVFVGAVQHLAGVLGIDPTTISLIIAPIATELPEKFNSVIWVRSRKDTLAMGNITGAMVFQSCIPTVLGLLFTPWVFSEQSAIHFASAGVAFVATILIFGMMLRRGALSAWSLLIGGPLYLVYLYLALLTPLGSTAAPVH
jgi:cation:H+ antiporter